MASLTLSIEEAIKIFKNTILTRWEKIKTVEIIDDSKIKAVIDANKFLPQITVILSFNSYSSGFLKFNITFTNSSKILNNFLKNINMDIYNKEVVKIENDLLYVDIKKLLSNSINWLNISSIKVTKNSLLLDVKIEDNKGLQIN